MKSQCPKSDPLTPITFSPDITRESTRKITWSELGDQPQQNRDKILVDVYPEIKMQPWEGLGGAVSEHGAKAVCALSEDKQTEFFKAIFSASEMAMAWVRLPVGSSDFDLDAYSHAEVADDWAMAHFSIRRDLEYKIPYLKKAKAQNPDLKIHASPWSPPGWMKKSGNMVGPVDSEILDTPEVFTAYARYLRCFVQAYAAEGLTIDRLMVQNEMDAMSPFPSCKFTSEQFVRFHVDYLKPEWEEHGIQTEVWAGTFRSIKGLQAHECFADSAFHSFVKGAAFQYTYPDVLQKFTMLYPDVPIVHTESVCNRGLNTEAESVVQFGDFMGYLDAGAQLYTYWNVVLSEEPNSTWGWKQNSLVTVDTRTGSLKFNPDYEVYKFLGQALPVGSRRLLSFSYQTSTLAFERPDGSRIVLLRNFDEAVSIQLNCKDVSVTKEVPACALVGLSI